LLRGKLLENLGVLNSKELFFNFAYSYPTMKMVKVSEFFPHILIQVLCKILQLDMQKKIIFSIALLGTKNGTSQVFLIK